MSLVALLRFSADARGLHGWQASAKALVQKSGTCLYSLDGSADPSASPVQLPKEQAACR